MLTGVRDHRVSGSCLWERWEFVVFVDAAASCGFPELCGHVRGIQSGADVVKDRAVGSFCKVVFLSSVRDCGVEGDVSIGVVSAEVV